METKPSSLLGRLPGRLVDADDDALLRSRRLEGHLPGVAVRHDLRALLDVVLRRAVLLQERPRGLRRSLLRAPQLRLHRALEKIEIVRSRLVAELPRLRERLVGLLVLAEAAVDLDDPVVRVAEFRIGLDGALEVLLRLPVLALL